MTSKDAVRAFPTSQGATGMELRDYFAAMALQGFIAAHAGTKPPGTVNAVTYAYQYADAMMAERSKEEKK